jgi:hypothetical protein
MRKEGTGIPAVPSLLLEIVICGEGCSIESVNPILIGNVYQMY